MPADVGDGIVFKSEFQMMKNINLLLVEHAILRVRIAQQAHPLRQRLFHPTASFFKWLDLLQQLQLPFTYISLTGGEPFLHPEVRDGSCLFTSLGIRRYPIHEGGSDDQFLLG